MDIIVGLFPVHLFFTADLELYMREGLRFCLDSSDVFKVNMSSDHQEMKLIRIIVKSEVDCHFYRN